MDGDALQQWRRERLRALAKKLGGNAPLGRALGYRDGAFVGQMISGVRPITEKTVTAAEQLPGARGWFQREGAPVSRPAEKGVVFEELNAEEKAFIEDFRTILDSDRAKIIENVAQRATELREYLAQHGRPGLPLVAPPRHSTAASKAAPPARTVAPAPQPEHDHERDHELAGGPPTSRPRGR